MVPPRRSAVFALTVLAVVLALIAPAAESGRQETAAADEPVLDLVGQTGGVVGSLAVQGDRVYAVVGTSLAVIDVSDAAAPRLVARSRPLDALITDLAVAGDRAYLAAGEELVVMDLAAPGGPAVVSTYRADGWFPIVAADGRNIYAVFRPRSGVSAFQVLSAADDSALSRIGEVELPGAIDDRAQMAVDGGTAYIAGGGLGVLAVDVTDPAAPAVIGAYEGLVATGIAVGQGRVYVIGYHQEVNDRGETVTTYFQLALSTRPGAFLTRDVVLELSDGANPSGASYIAAWDRFVYVGRSGGGDLHIVDGQQPDSMPEVGMLNLPWGFAWYHKPKSIAVKDGRVFVAVNGTCGLGCHGYGRFNGVLAIDGTPPGAVTGAWLVDEPAAPSAVVAGEGSVAVGGRTQTIHFVDTRTPTMPTFRGAIELDDLVINLAAYGHRLLSSTNVQAKLIDFSDPAAPRLIEDVDLGGLTDLRAVAIGRDLACAVGRNREVATEARLVVWGIGQDQHLTHRGELVLGPWPDFTTSLTVHEGYAYLTNLATGLTVIDLRDPGHPSVASQTTISRFPQDVAVADGYAYVTTILPTPDEEKVKPNPRPYGGLTVVNVTDPTQPHVVGTYAAYPDEYYDLGQHWAVAVVGRYAIVGPPDKWLHVLDVSDPAAPRPAQSIRVPSGVFDVAVAGDVVYVAAREGGLMVYRRHEAEGGGGRAGRLYLPFTLRPRAGQMAAGWSMGW
jgi:hypothetical protein